MSNPETILREIFTRQAGIDLKADMAPQVPGYDLMVEFATLLARDPAEEEIQDFLDRHPQLLLSTFGAGDPSILACLVKPPIGTQYRADFGLLRYDQGGFQVILVELERSGARLLTKAKTPAQQYQRAIGQVLDWKTWIEVNKRTFISEMIRLAVNAPTLAQRGSRGSFRTRDAKHIEGIARQYGSDTLPRISYQIVISRWGVLSEAEQTRLILTNQGQPGYATNTYDQLARQAFVSPWRGY